MINVVQEDSQQLARDEAVKRIQSVIEDADNPLLLLSGGSSIEVAAKLIQISLGLDRWTVAQVDERYGKVGHRNSNWQALINAGLEEGRFKSVLPILSDGLSADKTAKTYEQQLKIALKDCDVSIALIGMGADGHIAGMLPMIQSDFEKNFISDQLVSYFKGPDYERITLTQSALNALDHLIVFATGYAKVQSIRKIDDDVPVNEHPAQMLKYAKKVDVFTSER